MRIEQKNKNTIQLPSIENLINISLKLKITPLALLSKDYNSAEEFDYFWVFCECMGLDEFVAEELAKYNKNYINRIIINCLFIKKFIYRFADIVQDNIVYGAIYQDISKENPLEAKSINNVREFITWKNTQALADLITETSGEVSKILPKDFFLTKKNVNKNWEDINERASDLSQLMDLIESQFEIFKKYKIALSTDDTDV